MGVQDKADLRKEVDMNEHTDSIEDVAKQYKVSLEKGLSDSEVQEVITVFLRNRIMIYSKFWLFQFQTKEKNWTKKPRFHW